MILLLFFVAFAILIYLFVSTHRTVVVYQEPEPVSWWTWPITSYNWWPYWNGSYGGSYGGSHSGSYANGAYAKGTAHHKGPQHTPHQESRPWGGASRYANASAPSKGYGGHAGGHGAPSGGHGAPSGGHGAGGHGGGHGGGSGGGPSGGHGGGGHR